MIRKVLVGNDRRLRKKAAEVDPKTIPTPAMQALIDDMFETMETADGLGLAAPQIAISKRIIIVMQGQESTCLINPKIIRASKELRLGDEGCLSFPGLYGKVARHKWADVQAYDRDGKFLKFRAQDFDARVIQHEIDHLNGILLPDRLKEKINAPEVVYIGKKL